MKQGYWNYFYFYLNKMQKDDQTTTNRSRIVKPGRMYVLVRYRDTNHLKYRYERFDCPRYTGSNNIVSYMEGVIKYFHSDFNPTGTGHCDVLNYYFLEV